MRRTTVSLVCSLALLACGRDDVKGEDDAPPGGHDDDRPVVVDLPGDGDGDGDGDDAEPVCDLAQFPQLVPEWIVEADSPIEGALPSVDSLEVVGETIFVGGRHTVSSSQPPGFLERRRLDGELLWAVDLPRSPFSLSWDGSHVYASLGNEVRRWSGDGVEDDWVHKAQSISGVDAGGESVVIVGTYTEKWGHPEYFDAFYGVLTKTVPPQYSGYIHATPDANDRGQELGRSPWGGWIAAGNVSDPESLWLHGFAGSQFRATLDVGGHPNIHSMLGVDDLLLVIGRSSSEPRMWIAALGPDGSELWRRGVSLCGELRGSIRRLVLHDGRLWSLGTVRAHPDTYRPLLVQLGLDGTVEEVYALHSSETYARMIALASIGPDLYLGGHLHDEGGVKHRVIGKVQP